MILDPSKKKTSGRYNEGPMAQHGPGGGTQVLPQVTEIMPEKNKIKLKGGVYIQGILFGKDECSTNTFYSVARP